MSDTEQTLTKPRVSQRPGHPLRVPDLVRLWSPEYKIVLERQLWIAVLRAQRELGIDVPAEAIADYERVLDQVDLDVDRRSVSGSPGTT